MSQPGVWLPFVFHYCDVIKSMIASQITSLTIVYSIVHSGADRGKHQSSASLAFVRGIHRRLVNSPHKWPVTRKMFLFDEVIMFYTHSMWQEITRKMWTFGNRVNLHILLQHNAVITGLVFSQILTPDYCLRTALDHLHHIHIRQYNVLKMFQVDHVARYTFRLISNLNCWLPLARCGFISY